MQCHDTLFYNLINFIGYITVWRNKYIWYSLVSESQSFCMTLSLTYWTTYYFTAAVFLASNNLYTSYKYQKDNIFLLSVGLPSFASVVVWLVFPCRKQEVAQHYTLQRSLLWLFLIFTLAQARLNNTLP